MRKNSAYHTYNIPKGVYGEVSKIKEEILEFIDAEKQGDLILQMCELSDIYGAFEGYIEKHHKKTNISEIFAKITRPRYCECGKDLLDEYIKCFEENEPHLFWLANFGATLAELLDHPLYLNFEIEDLKKFSDKTKATKSIEVI